MRNNSYKLYWHYKYNIQEVNSTKILSKYTSTHWLCSVSSILTNQETQMVGNDQWPMTGHYFQRCISILFKCFLQFSGLHKHFWLFFMGFYSKQSYIFCHFCPLIWWRHQWNLGRQKNLLDVIQFGIDQRLIGQRLMVTPCLYQRLR